MNGIGFGLGDKADLVRSGKPLSVVYTLEENHWRNKVSIQMRIKDIKALY
jgi:single-stranded-DNA-specific exonuclease